MHHNQPASKPVSRRAFLRGAASLACAALVAGLAGCSLPGTSQEPEHVYGMPDDLADSTGSQAQTAVQTKQVTFPATYFAQYGVTNPEACLAGLGCTGIVANADGSYSASMPVESHAAFAEQIYQDSKAAIDALVGSEKYPTVTAVDYDEQFATVTVLFSQTSVTAEEALVVHIPGDAATIYQTIAGLPVGCDVILVGSDGSELVNAMFPQVKQDIAATVAPVESSHA